MIFKKRIAQIAKLIKIMKNPEERKTFLLSKMTLKNFILFGIFTNVVSTVVLMPIFNDTYINLSLTRLVSRIAGRIGDIKLPVFMRREIFESYIKFYKVNKDEILDSELTNYNTIKEFFIRKIKVNFFKKKQTSVC